MQTEQPKAVLDRLTNGLHLEGDLGPDNSLRRVNLVKPGEALCGSSCSFFERDINVPSTYPEGLLCACAVLGLGSSDGEGQATVLPIQQG